MKSNKFDMRMRVLIGYHGSESANAALDDSQKAGLPRELKTQIVSVGVAVMPHSLIGSERGWDASDSGETELVTRAHCSVEVVRSATD